MDLGLTGKNALVTGGSKGIGKSIALALAREGANVAIVARTSGPLEETAREIEKETGRTIVPLVADITSDEQVDAMTKEALKTLGSVHILVNNAAMPGGSPGGRGSITEIDNTAILGDFDVKVLGTIRCVRGVVEQMKQQGWGRIINIGGQSGRNAGNISSGARIAALVHLTGTLAVELGSYGITVNAVHPGATRTERTPGSLAERAKNEGISIEEAEKRAGGGNLIKRIIDSSEVADLTSFLASDRAGAITGEVIEVSGGATGRAVRF